MTLLVKQNLFFSWRVKWSHNNVSIEIFSFNEMFPLRREQSNEMKRFKKTWISDTENECMYDMSPSFEYYILNWV